MCNLLKLLIAAGTTELTFLIGQLMGRWFKLHKLIKKYKIATRWHVNVPEFTYSALPWGTYSVEVVKSGIKLLVKDLRTNIHYELTVKEFNEFNPLSCEE